MPPPTPAPPPLPGSYQNVLTFTESGDVADYTDERQGRVAALLAEAVGVAQTAVTIEVEAGSVLVTATVAADNEAAALAARRALAPLVNDAAALEAFLRSGGVDATLTAPSALETRDSSGASIGGGAEPDEGPSPIWPYVAVPAAIVGALMVLGCLVVFYIHRKSQRNGATDKVDSIRCSNNGRLRMRIFPSKLARKPPPPPPILPVAASGPGRSAPQEAKEATIGMSPRRSALSEDRTSTPTMRI